MADDAPMLGSGEDVGPAPRREPPGVRTMPVVDASLPLADLYEEIARAIDGTTYSYTARASCIEELTGQ